MSVVLRGSSGYSHFAWLDKDGKIGEIKVLLLTGRARRSPSPSDAPAGIAAAARLPVSANFCR